MSRQLHSLARAGDVEAMRALMSTGECTPSSVNDVDRNGDTALHIACLKEQPEAVRFLLSAGSLPDVGNRLGNRPLHYAAETGSVAVAAILLDAGAPVDARNNVRRAGRRQSGVARARGVDRRRCGHQPRPSPPTPALDRPRPPGRRGPAPQGRHRRPRGPRLLPPLPRRRRRPQRLGAPADTVPLRPPPHDQPMRRRRARARQRTHTPPATTQRNVQAEMTALHKACERGHPGVVNILLANGASPVSLDKDQRTPLLLASAKSHWDLATVLLASGPAAATAADRGGMTPLHYAARQNREELAAALLAAGADPFAQSREGMSATDMAAQGSNVRRALQTAPLR